MGGDKPKQFLDLSGKPIIAHTIDALSLMPFLSSIFLVVPREFIPVAQEIVSEPGGRGCSVNVVPGGGERQESVYNGLKQLPAECEWVLIHDGVRPFASPELITAAWEGARETGACIAALPATDTIKSARDGRVERTLARDEIWMVQTPQVFRKEIIEAAYDQAVRSGWAGTDDASFVERIGVPVAIVRGERSNIKVTTPEDLEWAQWFLSAGCAGKGDRASRVRV
jgi:2-C-methyl-D-erythritol 4-phosphate cytidylyltransferase